MLPIFLEIHLLEGNINTKGNDIIQYQGRSLEPHGGHGSP